MALSKPIWIRPNLVSKKKREPYREGEKRERERKKKRKRKRRRREEEEKKKKREKPRSKVWNLDFCMELHGF